jgi:hypothetical protein
VISFVIVAIGIGAVIVTRQTGYRQIQLDDVGSVVQLGIRFLSCRGFLYHLVNCLSTRGAQKAKTVLPVVFAIKLLPRTLLDS